MTSFTRRTALLAALAVATTTALTGCSSDETTGTEPTSTTTATAGPLTVFAAASLKSTFTELGKQFEAAHPGSTVTFNFAGSSDLVAQLHQGAPADVFASADTNNMTKAGDLVDHPVNFATNTLTIVTPPGNPGQVASFADLAKPGVTVVICAPQVPCGAATEKVEKSTGVTLTPVSEESSVTDVLGKVTSGQADAGLVYVTDAKNAGAKVTEVPFPESASAVNTYPIATVTSSTNPSGAAAFTELVTGPQGQRVLADAGFAAP